jgi:hypothetical protein
LSLQVCLQAIFLVNGVGENPGVSDEVKVEIGENADVVVISRPCGG